MIKIDRKVCRDILKLTHDYDKSLFFSPSLGGFSFWHNSPPEKPEIKSSAPLSEIYESLLRLEERGLIHIIQKSWNKDVIFRITPELLHYKAFWFDRFTRTYVAGFISGVLTALLSGLLIEIFLRLF